jgi:hypothetical protein
MLSTLSKTAVAATTALIISLAPIATADLAFAHGGGGGGGGSRGGGGHFGGGGGHFGGGQFGGGHFAGGHFAGGHFAGGAFHERGFHRHFGLFGGLFGDCGGPYSYPYPPFPSGLLLAFSLACFWPISLLPPTPRRPRASTQLWEAELFASA